MRYIDGDLGEYHEYGTNVMVNPPGSTASGLRALQSAGAFIHHLPVDQAFTLEAGQTIWGYPKVMADFTVREGRQFGFDVSIDGQLVAGMEFRPGLPVPPAFTTRKQVHNTVLASRRCRTRDTGRDVAYRCALSAWAVCGCGSGDHPYAKELASLGSRSAAWCRVPLKRGDDVRRRQGDFMTQVLPATKPDVDLADGNFYADGEAREAYRWMRANEPVFRDRNGLAAATTYQAVHRRRAQSRAVLQRRRHPARPAGTALR